MSQPLARAFLAQARADYAVYEHLLATPNLPPSQWLHPLQMALEKAAKACVAAAGQVPYDELRQSHHAFRRFIDVVDRNRDVRVLLGFSARQLRDHLNDLRPVVDGIEGLVPRRGHDGPTAEYPWFLPTNGVVAPCTHDFREVVDALNSSRGRNVLKLLNRVLRDERWQTALGVQPTG